MLIKIDERQLELTVEENEIAAGHGEALSNEAIDDLCDGINGGALCADEPDDTEFQALGRNGYTERVLDEIHIRPINSRGDLTQGRTPVPVEDLPALIKELSQWVS